MSTEWMSPLKLRLSPSEFRLLPRNASYKYTYHQGVAWLHPRPRYYHAWLNLPHWTAENNLSLPIRPLQSSDWDSLVELFALSFARQVPFCGLDAAGRIAAARQALEQTRAGGDGPWIERASFVATSGAGELLGALLITLVPMNDPTDWGAYVWEEPAPSDALERRLGRPHLTWIFVHPDAAGQGIGTALLTASCKVLREMDFQELHSTFLVGNESSTLWHWRTGFRLLSHPSSRRRCSTA